MKKVTIEFSIDGDEFWLDDEDEGSILLRYKIGEILNDLAYTIGEGDNTTGSVWWRTGLIGSWEVAL